jgi:hypothetical protein
MKKSVESKPKGKIEIGKVPEEVHEAIMESLGSPEDKLPPEIKQLIAAMKNKDGKFMTKAELLLALPPDIVPIVPALNISGLNAQDLCAKCFTWTSNIAEITEFAACVPLNSVTMSIYDVLHPIAAKGLRLSDSNRALKNLLFPLLKKYITAEIKSCAGLANGDTVLFSQIGCPTKKAAVKYNLKLPIPSNVAVDTKQGRSIVVVDCDVLPHAIKGYCVAYGDPATDPDTWSVLVGGRKQQLPPQEPGKQIGVQKAGIGKMGVGFFCETILVWVPLS